jgi:pimeloyl-ACP methyl ester carboxylesterase
MRRLAPLALALALHVACAPLPASDAAADALVSDGLVTVEAVGRDLLAFHPRVPRTDRAVAFYPGGLVEEDAYAPLLRRVALGGVTAVLVPMPADLAVLAPRKADDAVDALPELGPWIAAGHSLGGAMAATWADVRRDDVAGLALLAAYPAAGRDLSDAAFPALSITASEDGVLDRDTWEERRDLLPADATFLEIAGGNHAGFGAYGPQRGDGEATLPALQQWDQAAAALAAWVLEHDAPAPAPISEG